VLPDPHFIGQICVWTGSDESHLLGLELEVFRAKERISIFQVRGYGSLPTTSNPDPGGDASHYWAGIL